MLNAESILDDGGIEERREENETERRNDSENEGDSDAGGKVNTVITVTIRSVGGVNQRAETLNTSEHSWEAPTRPSWVEAQARPR